MTEIEAQPFGTDERTFLLDMLSKNPSQCGMQEVRRRMVPLRSLTVLPVNRCPAGQFSAVERQIGRVDRAVASGIASFRDDMNDRISILSGIGYLQTVLRGFYPSAIARLSAAFSIKRCAIKNYKNPVGQHAHSGNGGELFKRIVTGEYRSSLF